jgi:hypothetical protein
MTLQLIPSKFPYIQENFRFLFFQCGPMSLQKSEPCDEDMNSLFRLKTTGILPGTLRRHRFRLQINRSVAAVHLISADTRCSDQYALRSFLQANRPSSYFFSHGASPNVTSKHISVGAFNPVHASYNHSYNVT